MAKQPGLPKYYFLWRGEGIRQKSRSITSMAPVVREGRRLDERSSAAPLDPEPPWMAFCPYTEAYFLHQQKNWRNTLPPWRNIRQLLQKPARPQDTLVAIQVLQKFCCCKQLKIGLWFCSSQIVWQLCQKSITNCSWVEIILVWFCLYFESRPNTGRYVLYDKTQK